MAIDTRIGDDLAAVNQQTLARLARVLDYAEGFTLLFSPAATSPAERQRWMNEATQRSPRPRY